MRPILIALALLLAMPVAAQSTLTVTGEGAAAVAPDMAVVTLGTVRRDAEAEAAMTAVSDALDTVIARLRDFGIAPADLQTTDLSLRPIYADRSLSGQVDIEGFEASNRLTVRVRDLDSLGDVLGAALENGANDLSGLHFTLQDPRPVMDGARRAAVADARAKAELYAGAADVRLGPIQSIEEAGGTSPAPMMQMEARGAPIEAGETTLRAQVRIVWALEP